MSKKRETTDALAIIYDRHYRGRPDRERTLRETRKHVRVGIQLREIRLQAGLSQRSLAAAVGTTASVICRLENADYDGHSLSMLRRVAAALNADVDIRITPRVRRPRAA